MQVQLTNVPFNYRRLIKRLFKTTLCLTGNEKVSASIGVKFASEEEIRALNKEFRQVDKVTDVLSFPMLDIKVGDKISDFSEECLPNGSIYLGDIAVCVKRAKEQAEEYGHSLKRELAFLIVHGFLHVLGYDHMTKSEEEQMMNLAENILLNHGLERTL